MREEVRDASTRVANRTQPRTHLGYLVGYEGSNIYRIWIPSKATVVRTRDVDFVETEFFNPDKHEKRVGDAIQIDESSPEPLPDRSNEESESETESTIIVEVPDQDQEEDQEQESEEECEEQESSPP
jgi:hypothetical protein